MLIIMKVSIKQPCVLPLCLMWYEMSQQLKTPAAASAMKN